MKILKVNSGMSWRNVWDKWQILQQREPWSLMSFLHLFDLYLLKGEVYLANYLENLMMI